MLLEYNGHSSTSILKKKKLYITAEAIGGNEYRNVALHNMSGVIYYREGTSRQKVLWGRGKIKMIMHEM